jgi:hypothetical protein
MKVYAVEVSYKYTFDDEESFTDYLFQTEAGANKRAAELEAKRERYLELSALDNPTPEQQGEEFDLIDHHFNAAYFEVLVSPVEVLP